MVCAGVKGISLIRDALEKVKPAYIFLFNTDQKISIEINEGMDRLKKLRESIPPGAPDGVINWESAASYIMELTNIISNLRGANSSAAGVVFNNLEGIRNDFIAYSNIDRMFKGLDDLISNFRVLILNVQNDIEAEIYWFEFKIPFCFASISILYWVTNLEHSYLVTH